jgi:hypothetical protein
MTLHRRATDSGEPTNRDLMLAIEKMDREFVEYVREHSRDHGALQSRLGLSDTATAVSDVKLRNVELATLDVKALHDFRVQVETLGSAIKFVVGGSVIAALAAIASLIVSIAHATGH